MRIFGVDEDPDEEIFAKVVSKAEKAGATVNAIDVSTCHRLPGGDRGPKSLMGKFVRRDNKHQLMKLKRNLRETIMYVIDDLPHLRAKKLKTYGAKMLIVVL